MTFPDSCQTMNNLRNKQNGTIFALIDGVGPGLSSYLSIQSCIKLQSGETEQRSNGLLHI